MRASYTKSNLKAASLGCNPSNFLAPGAYRLQRPEVLRNGVEPGTGA
jgi:hypothetical protein